MPGDRHAEAAEEARRDLQRLEGQSDVIGGFAMARAAKRAREHFSAGDAPGGDAAEVWGRRIGRGLSALLVVVLLWWLAAAYVLE